MGNPFTLRRIHAGEWWGLWECRCPVYPPQPVAPRNPPKFLLFLWIYGSSGTASRPELAKWLESHPQREDLYAALRPLLAERPRQDRTFS